MARPQKTAALTEAQIVELATLGCTDSEIAALAGLDEATVKRSFAPLLKNGRAVLRHGLRKAQIEKAKGGDTTMLIWLGKQYLDQRDKTEHSADPERPLVFDHRAAVAALAAGSASYSGPSGAGEGGGDGAEVG